MKIIDLLNKIANGEDVPKKIKVDDSLFENDDFDYFANGCGYLFNVYYPTEDILNKEVEIIEEDKKIEKLKKRDFEDNFGGLAINDGKFINKINEIIEELNGRN